MPSGADRKPFWFLVAGTAVLDRLTKVWAEGALGDGRVIEVIGEYARFRLLYNPGAAFGMHLGAASRWIFLAIAVGAIVVLRQMAKETDVTDRLKQFALGFVAGGAMGNGIDRIVSAPGVVDFVDLGVGATRFWTFNVADTAVSLGAIALGIALWREDRRARTAASGATPG